MSRTIEFMGLPASGKSLLASSLLQHDAGLLSSKEAVVRCTRRRDDGFIINLLKRLPPCLWEAAAGSRHAGSALHTFSADYVSFMALWLEVLNRQPLKNEWKQCLLYVLHTRAAEWQVMKEFLRKGEGVVVEEGFAQGFLSMIDGLPAEGSFEQDLQSYVEYMPISHAVFWVDVAPQECLRRLRRRPELPLLWENMNEEELLKKLTYDKLCMEKMADLLKGRGVAVCRVDNAEDKQEEARALVADQGKNWSEKIRKS